LRNIERPHDALPKSNFSSAMTLIIGSIGAKMLRKHYARLVNATYPSSDKDARLSAGEEGRHYRVRSDPGVGYTNKMFRFDFL
jgi:hypothetical protein